MHGIKFNYLAWQVNIEMIEPVECGDARLNGVMKHLSSEDSDDGGHIKISVGVSVTAMPEQNLNVQRLIIRSCGFVLNCISNPLA